MTENRVYKFYVIKVEENFHLFLNDKYHSDSIRATKDFYIDLNRVFKLEIGDLDLAGGGIMINIRINSLQAWSDKVSNYVHEIKKPLFMMIYNKGKFEIAIK